MPKAAAAEAMSPPVAMAAQGVPLAPPGGEATGAVSTAVGLPEDCTGWLPDSPATGEVDPLAEPALLGDCEALVLGRAELGAVEVG